MAYFSTFIPSILNKFTMNSCILLAKLIENFFYSDKWRIGYFIFMLSY